jgi:hypothetical protein
MKMRSLLLNNLFERSEKTKLLNHLTLLDVLIQNQYSSQIFKYIFFLIQYGSVKAKNLCESQFFN